MVNSKENADITFLTARGDTMLVLIKNLRDRRKEELTMLDTIIDMMDAMDSNIQFVGEGTSTAQSRMVELLKQLRPEETKGLSDEEIMKLVGGKLNVEKP